MASNINGLTPLSYKGVEASSPPNLVKIGRAPTSNDIKNFNVGDIWLDTANDDAYMLVDASAGVATWQALAASTAGASMFVTDSGTANTAGATINVLGGELISSTGSGSTVTLDLERGTNGQLIIGATSAPAAWANITSSGGTITITEGANSINLEAAGSAVTLQLDGDSGSATPLLGIINIAGGNNVTTSAASNTVTVNVSGTTDHAVQVGNASGSLTSLTVGSTGEVLVGSTGADPAFAALGTNSALTNHGVLLGQGNSPIAATSVGSDGAVLTGNSAADPTFEDIGTRSGLTANGVVLSNNLSAFTATTAGTDGQVLLGATSGAPAFATLTSSGGTITFTPGANTLNLEASGGGSGLTWSEVTGTSQAMAVNNGYILNNAGLVTATLPATATVGDIIAVQGKGAGGWRIAQNAGQTIHWVDTDTTTGATGRLDSTAQYDSVELVCITANTDFAIRNSMGNITIT